MVMNKEKFKGRDLLSLYDFSSEEITYLLDYASWLKAQQKKNTENHLLKGKSLGMIFQKNSTRTRISFEVAMLHLGGNALFLSSRDLQLGRGESIYDTGKVLSRYLDGIMIRTFEHREVEELAYAADIPVINGLTNLYHPCQALADLMTIKEKRGKLSGIKLAYLGDGNNVAHSLLIGGAKIGMNVTVGCPTGYEPNNSVLEKAQKEAELTGAKLEICYDPVEAVQGADIIYTDVWTSMGQEDTKDKREKVFKLYQVNNKLMQEANSDALVMHCLPAHRGEEITEEVMDGPQSTIFDQAENRLHAQKAVLALLMGN